MNIATCILHRPWLVRLALCGTVGLLMLVWLCGCAVGRNDVDGSIVLGWKAGQLVENTNQAIAAAANVAGGLLPPPFGQILTLSGIGIAAHLSGKNRGWDDREKAGSTQQPLKENA